MPNRLFDGTVTQVDPKGKYKPPVSKQRPTATSGYIRAGTLWVKRTVPKMWGEQAYEITTTDRKVLYAHATDAHKALFAEQMGIVWDDMEIYKSYTCAAFIFYKFTGTALPSIEIDELYSVKEYQMVHWINEKTARGKFWRDAKQLAISINITETEAQRKWVHETLNVLTMGDYKGDVDGALTILAAAADEALHGQPPTSTLPTPHEDEPSLDDYLNSVATNAKTEPDADNHDNVAALRQIIDKMIVDYVGNDTAKRAEVFKAATSCTTVKDALAQSPDGAAGVIAKVSNYIAMQQPDDRPPANAKPAVDLEALREEIRSIINTRIGLMGNEAVFGHFKKATQCDSLNAALDCFGTRQGILDVVNAYIDNLKRHADSGASDKPQNKAVNTSENDKRSNDTRSTGTAQNVPINSPKDTQVIAHHRNSSSHSITPTHQMAMTGDPQWDAMRQQAEIMIRSGLLPSTVNTIEKVITVGLMGQALGLLPIVAINNIDVIRGKPTVKPQLMLALIRRSGQLQDMTINDDGFTCTVTMTRKGNSPHIETFSMDNAKAMELTTNDNWKKQPATMRRWRAISAACRIVFPDIIFGFYTPEELDPNVIVEAEIA